MLWFKGNLRKRLIKISSFFAEFFRPHPSDKWARRASGEKTLRLFGVLFFLFPVFAAPVASRFESLIADFENLFVFAAKFIIRCNISDGAVKSVVIILINIFGNDSARIFQAQKTFLANTLIFDRLMPGLDFTICLWMVHRSPDMRQVRFSEKSFKVQR